MKKKITVRLENDKKILQKRLKLIEGQVRGISQMVQDDRYCYEILIQISAVNKALKSLGNIILKNHLENCVVDEIKNDNLEVIDEIMDLVKQLN